MRFEFPFILIGKSSMSFLTGQSCRVLKSWYTGGDPEQGFRRCLADGLNQMLVSPVAQAILNSPPTNATDKPVIRTYTQSQCHHRKSVPALPSDVPAQQPSEPPEPPSQTVSRERKAPYQQGSHSTRAGRVTQAPIKLKN